jgi:hypothetical protein
VTLTATAPLLPDLQGHLNDTTLELAMVCRAHAEAEQVARPDLARRMARAASMLERCAEREGWRCGLVICPRCQRRAAVRYRRRLEARLRSPGASFALLTATVAGDDLRLCERTLVRALSALRRRRAWQRAVVGGEQHLQAEPCRPGSARRWNVHVHAVLERRPGAGLAKTALADVWASLIAPSGLPGRLDLRPIAAHWAISRS